MKKLAAKGHGESDSDEGEVKEYNHSYADDSIDGWVTPSKKLKIDENIKFGSDTVVSLDKSRDFQERCSNTRMVHKRSQLKLTCIGKTSRYF